jgi:hypothetical protein
MEVASLVLALPLVLGGIAKCIKLLNEIREEGDDRIQRVLFKCRVLDRALSQLLEAGRSNSPDAMYHDIHVQCNKAIDRMQKFAEQMELVVSDPATLNTSTLNRSARIRLVLEGEHFKSIIEELDDCGNAVQLYLTLLIQRYKHCY